MPSLLYSAAGYPISDIDFGSFGVFERTVKVGPPRAEADAFYSMFNVFIWESPGVLAKFPWLQNPYPVFPKADNTTPIDMETGLYAYGATIDGINYVGERDWVMGLMDTVPMTPFWEALVDKLDSVGIKRFDFHPSI